MKTKFIIATVLLIAAYVFAQDKPPDPYKDFIQSGALTVSKAWSIPLCKQHGKHPIRRYTLTDDEGIESIYEVCNRDAVQAELQALRNAGVSIEKIK